MSTYETAEVQDTDRSPDLSAPVFGVDRDGGMHRFDDGDVVVTRGDELDHLERDVGREGVPAWISYVGQERGWIDVWWTDEAADAIGRLGAALRAIENEHEEVR